MSPPRVKICGITALEAAHAAGSRQAIGWYETPANQARLARLQETPAIDYLGTFEMKRAMLSVLAVENTAANTDPAVVEYARFRAVREKLARPWRQWPERLRGGDLTGAAYDPAVFSFYANTQGILREQFAALAAQSETMADIARALAIERDDDTGVDMLFWAEATQNSIEAHCRDLDLPAEGAPSMAARLMALEETARTTALAMEFGFLLDRDRKLLSIGYLVREGALDPSCYDLLASEARLASFVGIAQGQLGQEHWFALGRLLTTWGPESFIVFPPISARDRARHTCP